jgi:hypothetical protein
MAFIKAKKPRRSDPGGSRQSAGHCWVVFLRTVGREISEGTAMSEPDHRKEPESEEPEEPTGDASTGEQQAEINRENDPPA